MIFRKHPQIIPKNWNDFLENVGKISFFCHISFFTLRIHKPRYLLTYLHYNAHCYDIPNTSAIKKPRVREALNWYSIASKLQQIKVRCHISFFIGVFWWATMPINTAF